MGLDSNRTASSRPMIHTIVLSRSYIRGKEPIKYLEIRQNQYVSCSSMNIEIMHKLMYMHSIHLHHQQHHQDVHLPVLILVRFWLSIAGGDADCSDR
mmetsp:Transcript_24282/g.43044  ORF Transcript_24282/g.43044 Transcript_24282/m.43044 type:complete len:97 (+) Transcript_24282:611-901(+)